MKNPYRNAFIARRGKPLFLVSLGVILIGNLFYLDNQPVNHARSFEELSTDASLSQATFAGGCFWCMEGPFEHEDGVVEVFSGYTGGTAQNPTYEKVTTGTTGHVEAVRVFYDAEKVSYKELLDIFWRNIDPTDDGGQFGDRGSSYNTGIFYHDYTQQKLAEESKNELEEAGRFDKPIVTPIVNAGPFYIAEDYHQNYYKTHPLRYKFYRAGSGRDKFFTTHWNKGVSTNSSKDLPDMPTDGQLRERLTELQYRVTQQEGTEPPYKNEYWDHKEDGIYVDIVSGQALFSSTDKYDSKTGWPSFTKPIADGVLVEKIDYKLLVPRTEIKSTEAKSHLGHIFKDGPKEAGGLRYCINSAALRFVPKENMNKEGHGQYLSLFE